MLNAGELKQLKIDTLVLDEEPTLSQVERMKLAIQPDPNKEAKINIPPQVMGKTVITGRKRIRAWQALGHNTILVQMVTGNDKQLQLEALYVDMWNDGITELERAEKLARAKKLYDEIHQTGKGGDHKSGKFKAAKEAGLLKKGFRKEASREMNCDPTTVDRLLACSKLHEGTKKYILKEAEKDRLALLKWEEQRAKKIAAPKPNTLGLCLANNIGSLRTLAAQSKRSEQRYRNPSYQLKLAKHFVRGLHREGSPVEGQFERRVPFRHIGEAERNMQIQERPTPKPSDRFEVYQADVFDHIEKAALIEDHSIDLLLVDPWWEKNSVEGNINLIDGIGNLAVRVLKEKGRLVIMYGQRYLKQAMIILDKIEGLEYRWEAAYIAMGHKSAVHNASEACTRFKPLLVYTRRYNDDGTPNLPGPDSQFYTDVFFGGGTDEQGQPKFTKGKAGSDKSIHEHQQDTPAFIDMVKAWCPEKGKVFDCCCGSGTTLIATILADQDRTCVGFDINKEHVEDSKRLCDEAVESQMKNESALKPVGKKTKKPLLPPAPNPALENLTIINPSTAGKKKDVA